MNEAISRLDLLLRNCQLVNVCSREIYSTDISIRDGRVLSIEPRASAEAASMIDCAGLFAVPGMIDAHMHVDTTLLWPTELARVLVPLGTTSVFVDTTNVSHTGGKDAVRALMESFRGLPLKGFAVAPSYTPFNPRLETAAVELSSEDICALLDEGCVGIGETVWSKIVLGDGDYLEGIKACRDRGKRVSGHGGEIARGDEAAFDAYTTAGLQDDHCVSIPEDILPRLRRGLKLFCVEASGRRGQLAPLIREAVIQNRPFRQMCLCVDNITIMDIHGAGHGYLDNLVRIALKEGVPPVDAFRMVSLEPAEHYRRARDVGCIAPGRAADILLMRSLGDFPPEKVIVDGRIVAERGRLMVDIPPARVPDFYRHSIHLGKVDWKQLEIPALAGHESVRARVINTHDGDAYNEASLEKVRVENGAITVDPEHDILKIVMVERYGRHGEMGVALVRGFGLRRGAMATSMTIPSNNIAAVGVSDNDIRFAIERVGEIQGGYVVVADGKIRAEVRLPLGGIMAEEPFEGLVAQIAVAETAARELGCGLVHPLFTLAQTVLSTLPALGLTDQGLVDARSARVVAVIGESPA
ncbi:MAG: adenine deaminase C-terminal domain-containing protein [Verrucomicrobiota bacterium]